MSFFSDLAHGNFSNLGTDLTHAPESFAKHPGELIQGAEAAGAIGLTALTLGADLPALGAGFGGLFGADAATGAALPFAADAGSGAGASLFDPAAWGASADAAIPSTATSTVGDSSLVNGALGLNPADSSLTGGANSGILTGGNALGVSPDAFAAQSGGTPALGGDAVGTPKAAGGNTWSNFLSDPLGSLGKAAAPTPLQLASAGAGAAGLGYNILQGQKTNGNVQALKDQAQTQALQGQALENYIQSGTLPPGLAAQMSQAIAANKARIISNAAAQGQSTDPTKNSALAQDLNTVDMQAQAMQGQIATQLLSSGQNAVNMSDQIYQALAQIDLTQAQNMGKAIASFAASLAGKSNVPVGGGQTITIGAG